MVRSFMFCYKIFTQTSAIQALQKSKNFQIIKANYHKEIRYFCAYRPLINNVYRPIGLSVGMTGFYTPILVTWTRKCYQLFQMLLFLIITSVDDRAALCYNFFLKFECIVIFFKCFIFPFSEFLFIGELLLDTLYRYYFRLH